LNKLTSHIRNGGDVKRTRTVVVRLGRLPIVIDSAIDLAGDTDSDKNNALLLLTDLEERRVVSPHSTEEVFGLTATQARVASLLAEGSSLAEIARDIGITPGTARNHLKAVFARTGTRRQGELVSLLSRLR
jgi:DNA-binding CsgD family transcriptional regulator